jgi:hypothetical protein
MAVPATPGGGRVAGRRATGDRGSPGLTLAGGSHKGGYPERCSYPTAKRLGDPQPGIGSSDPCCGLSPQNARFPTDDATCRRRDRESPERVTHLSQFGNGLAPALRIRESAGKEGARPTRETVLDRHLRGRVRRSPKTESSIGPRIWRSVSRPSRPSARPIRAQGCRTLRSSFAKLVDGEPSAGAAAVGRQPGSSLRSMAANWL